MIREQQRDEKTTVARPASTAVRTPRHSDRSAVILAAYLRELANQGSQAIAGYGTVRTR